MPLQSNGAGRVGLAALSILIRLLPVRVYAQNGYITTGGSNTVPVIGTSINKVIGTILVGLKPELDAKRYKNTDRQRDIGVKDKDNEVELVAQCSEHIRFDSHAVYRLPLFCPSNL